MRLFVGQVEPSGHRALSEDDVMRRWLLEIEEQAGKRRSEEERRRWVVEEEMMEEGGGDRGRSREETFVVIKSSGTLTDSPMLSSISLAAQLAFSGRDRNVIRTVSMLERDTGARLRQDEVIDAEGEGLEGGEGEESGKI